MWIIQNEYHKSDFSIEMTPDELKLLEKKAEREMSTVETTLRKIIQNGFLIKT